MTEKALRALLDELLAKGRETEWVEFKLNDEDPDEIGEYISALANSACLHDKPEAYLIWGIENQTLRVLGTSFKPYIAKVGNEELENWLSRMLAPGVEFRFHEVIYQGRTVVVMAIPAASHTPIQFKGVEYIRVGTYKKKLKDFAEKQKELWRRLSLTAFEKGIARSAACSDDVLRLVDYPACSENRLYCHQPSGSGSGSGSQSGFETDIDPDADSDPDPDHFHARRCAPGRMGYCFELLGIPLPDTRVGILDRLQDNRVIATRGIVNK